MLKVIYHNKIGQGSSDCRASSKLWAESPGRRGVSAWPERYTSLPSDTSSEHLLGDCRYSTCSSPKAEEDLLTPQSPETALQPSADFQVRELRQSYCHLRKSQRGQRDPPWREIQKMLKTPHYWANKPSGFTEQPHKEPDAHTEPGC